MMKVKTRGGDKMNDGGVAMAGRENWQRREAAAPWGRRHRLTAAPFGRRHTVCVEPVGACAEHYRLSAVKAILHFHKRVSQD